MSAINLPLAAALILEAVRLGRKGYVAVTGVQTSPALGANPTAHFLGRNEYAEAGKVYGSLPRQIPTTMMIGVGAAFDIHSGRVRLPFGFSGAAG